MSTLYCPTCAYNLTGLSENRCPECGTAFDPYALTLIARSVEPITIEETFGRVIRLPAGFVASILPAFVFPPLIVIPLFLMFLLLLGGPSRCLGIAARLADSAIEHRRRPMTQRDRSRFITAVAVTLFVLQVALAFGGAYFLLPWNRRWIC